MNILKLDLEPEFIRAFTRGGSVVVECNCGREHVCINSDYLHQDFDDEEMISNYRERAKTDNMLILNYSDDTLCVIELNGLVFAEGCECKGWIPYMNFILSQRIQIKRFLIKIAEKAQIALEQEQVFNILKSKELDILDEPPF